MSRGNVAMERTLLPGDIVFTHGNAFINRAIRFFTRRIGEGRSKVDHVALVVVGGSLEQAVIVEALRTVERHRLVDEYGGLEHKLAIYRPTRLARDKIQGIVAKAESYVGRDYGYGKIVLHALDWVLQGAYVFRRLGRMDDYPICSWLVAHAYGEAGVHFGVDPGAASPDDIWDYVTGQRGDFVRVRELARVAKPQRRAAA